MNTTPPATGSTGLDMLEIAGTIREMYADHDWSSDDAQDAAALLVAARGTLLAAARFLLGTADDQDREAARLAN